MFGHFWGIVVKILDFLGMDGQWRPGYEKINAKTTSFIKVFKLVLCGIISGNSTVAAVGCSKVFQNPSASSFMDDRYNKIVYFLVVLILPKNCFWAVYIDFFHRRANACRGKFSGGRIYTAIWISM